MIMVLSDKFWLKGEDAHPSAIPIVFIRSCYKQSLQVNKY